MLRNGGPPDASSSFVGTGVRGCKPDTNSSQSEPAVKARTSDEPNSSNKNQTSPSIFLGPGPEVKAISPFTLTIEVPPGWDPNAWSTKTITTRMPRASAAQTPATDQGSRNKPHSKTPSPSPSPSPHPSAGTELAIASVSLPTATTIPAEELESANSAGVKILPGAIVGGLFGLAVASLGVWWVFRRMRQRTEAQRDRRSSGTEPVREPQVKHNSVGLRLSSGKGHGKMVETRPGVQNEVRSSVVHGGDGFF